MPSARRGWVLAAMSEGQLAVAGSRDDARLAGFAGIASVVLFVVSVFFTPAPPKIDDSGVKVVQFFTDHASSVRLQGYFVVLALAGAFLIAAGIRERLRASGTSAVWTATYFGATITVLATLLVESAGFVALAIDKGAAGPRTSHLVYVAMIEIGPFVSCAVGISMAALAVGALRHGAFPRALGLFAAAFAVYELVEGLCVTGTSGALAAQGAINMLGPLFYLVVTLWASIVLVRDSPG